MRMWISAHRYDQRSARNGKVPQSRIRDQILARPVGMLGMKARRLICWDTQTATCVRQFLKGIRAGPYHFFQTGVVSQREPGAQARLENTLTPAPAICIAEHFDASGAIADSTTPAFVSQKILSGLKAPTNPPTDWALIEAPRLGIFDLPSV